MSQYVPFEEVRRTEFFEDCCKPLDMFHVMGSSLDLSGEGYAFFSTYRGQSVGEFDETQLDRCRLLIPHLKVAANVAARLGEARRRALLSAELLDRLRFAIFLLDACGTVLYANRAAQELLTGQDGLSTAQGRLVAAASDDRAALDRMIARAAGRLASGIAAGGYLAIARPSRGKPLSAIISPLPGEASGPQGTRRPAVAVLVGDPEQPTSRPPTRLLRLVFGLTPREALLVQYLSQGCSPADAARAMNISEATARTHLKQVLSKTGTHRQAELLALVTAAVPAVELESDGGDRRSPRP